MLTKRIIPCLDIRNGRVVKGINFVKLRDAGSPVECAKRYERWGADELTFLDITASHEKREIVRKLVESISKNIFTPFTVGGGLRSVDDIRAVLFGGADKVSLNTVAVENPKIITEAAAVFGSQCVVAAIDARRVSSGGTVPAAASGFKILPGKSRWEVFIYGGRRGTGIDALKWAQHLSSIGAGEILLTSMDRDGTKKGFDLPMVDAVSLKVNIPVIASGGAGSMKDFYEVFSKTGADAALAASIFHYGLIKIEPLKKYLLSKKILVRL